MMDFLRVIKAFVLEWYPVIFAMGGTIIAVGTIVLTVYLKFKPIYDSFKNKLDAIKNKVVDADAEDVSTRLQTVDINNKIAELEDKIANPLTSESSRVVYTQSLKILIEIKIKTEAGLIKAEEVEGNF